MSRIHIITNVCVEPYLRTDIEKCFKGVTNELQISMTSFEEHRDGDNVNDADIVVICLNYDELYPNILNDVSSGRVTYKEVESDCIHKCENLLTYIKNNSKAHIIWFGFDDYNHIQNNNYGTLLVYDGLVDQIKLSLKDILNDDTFVDFKRLIANVGIDKAYDIKSKYRWNAPYSKEVISVIANEIYKQYLIITGNTKKCLVLDCDNVLWGGILSEDGIAGSQVGESGLGRPFQDFQRYLLDLYYHGVILTVSSKNDSVDVLRVFREHTGMILKEEHMSCFRCNWDNKPNNIRDISEILNIGIDSIVFVDDSTFEIESVKAMLPEVTAVLYKRENIYDELSCFNLKRDVDPQVARERTITYKTNAMRSELYKNSLSYEDYISSLEMVVDIHEAKTHELSRISDLTQRTNKCTNGRRYTIENLKEKIVLHNYKLYTVCLSDKFSNLGIVGVIGIENNNLDLFSLSCRALGRGIEEKMLHMAIGKGVYNASYTDTGKNVSLIDGMKRLGIKMPE